MSDPSKSTAPDQGAAPESEAVAGPEPAADTRAPPESKTVPDGGAAPPADDVLRELFGTIEDRKAELSEGSYTASLFTHEKGENAVLEKLGEEATEILLAAKDDDADELAHESADFVYHLLVLLSMKGMDVDDLLAELEARF